MRVTSIGKNQPNKGWFFDKLVPFFSRYGLLIVALLFGLPPLIKYIRTVIASMKENTEKNKVIVNNAENGNANPTTIKKKVTEVKKRYPNLKQSDLDRFSTVAQGVAYALGTNVEDNHFVFNIDFYNFVASFEDEKEVVRLLKTVPTTFPVVEDMYYSVHTRSRNLKNDLLKYLEKSDLDEIRAVQKKYGKTFI